MKRFLPDFAYDEIAAEFAPSFRAAQIFQWVYRRYVTDFEQISTLPKTMRADLAERFTLEGVAIAAKQTSEDGSVKYLFRLADGHTIEAVLLLMREEQRDDEEHTLKQAQYTICLSTQVGCKIGCAFCMTAKGGFERNLSAGEIVSQVLLIKRDRLMDAEKGLNIVYMGMGEPLDNLDNVAKAIAILSCKDGLNISPRRQTLSTSGISPKIAALGKMNLGVLLAISLHAVDNETRLRLMPINKAYDIASIIAAVRAYPIDLRKRVMFEYLMIKGINDSLECAKKLVKLLSGLRAKVNLIAFNPHEGSDFERPSAAAIEAFQRLLLDRGLLCVVRQSRGIDIDAACGQLRERLGVKAALV
ncbi:MAG: 23S rRNA (adenine(2503)-C(2))-methyltransferase RlmN [Helicobacteraceae bacterium]|jgi:23S rRNA (adenine2503-C2)-methyltransferase|nr:23S rRNA (adenine(2503)-C(2))-methyltransferase RlmN [Helicobacteraceae bacterium]